jgi:hypothetical protein
MTITSVSVLAYDGTWREIGPYCDIHRHFLAYPEMASGVCWRCAPEAIPPEYEQHLQEVRKRARAKAARGAKRPVPPLTDAVDEDDA